MTPDEVGAQLSESGSGMRKETPPDYVIDWKKIATVFNQNLLVATLSYAYSDAGGRLAKQLLFWPK